MGGRLRGSLGSGATRTWPPPWPLLGLPLPAAHKGTKRVIPRSQTPHPLFKIHHLVVVAVVGGCSSPRWSWPRRSQSGSPRLPLPQHSPLPSWSSCPPSYRSQPFLSVGTENSIAICFMVENSHTWGWGLLPLLPSWLLVQAWAGPVSMTTIDKNQAGATLIQHCLISSTYSYFPANCSY